MKILNKYPKVETNTDGIWANKRKWLGPSYEKFTENIVSAIICHCKIILQQGHLNKVAQFR